jgi:hypothetical protein
MKWLYKLERKYGKYAIKNLMMYIVGLNAVIYILTYMDTTGESTYRLMLIPSLVLKGEVWRLITYIFIPPAASIIFIIFVLYFYYMIGTSLEHEWGSFKFNIYYLIGMLGTTLAAFISGNGQTGFYLNLSLFLAFAYIYPNYEMLVFFVLPVKMKYMAWLDVAFLGYSFLMGDLSVKLAIVAALINFFIFFGKGLMTFVKGRGFAYNNKRKYVSQVPKRDTFHKCTICGVTEKDDKQMEFRYCSSCEGHHEYCMEHLRNHEHIKKNNVIDFKKR